MKILLLASLVLVAVTAEESKILNDYAVGQAKFTANVYKELLKSNSGNFLVCPLSADIVLALLHEGAKGKTAQQISQGLHLPESNNEIQAIIRELVPHLKGNDKYSLSSANKIYLKNGLAINDEFKKTAVDVYDAEIQNIEFSKPDEAANEINKWVERKTHDKIKNLLAPSDLGASVRAVLVNALYFKGPWQKPFKVGATEQRVFHVNNKEEIKIDMMQQTGWFHYLVSSELKAVFLEIPYAGDEVTMTIVLPDEIEGLSALEEKLDDVLVPHNYERENVHLVIPKFKTETTIEFKPILEALGIVDIFGASADLSGITANHESMTVSKVVQKTFIEIDEQGTTAAAATAIVTKLTSGVLKSTPFIADRPFIYYLKSSAGILFVGRYIKE